METNMMVQYRYILDLAIILLSTKVLGLLTKRFHMPQVVGALLAGLLLGPAVFGILSETELIDTLAELGVIVLMFCAGLETDTKELKRSGKASFVIALIGVLVPLAGGFGVAYLFNRPGIIDSDAGAAQFLQNIFIGIILTATSVSITVETLKEIGKLKTRSGNAILGAAIIDDILGIIGLTIITSMADTNVRVEIILLKIAGFFAFALVAGYAFYLFYKKWSNPTERGLRRHVIVAFVFCLVMAFVAEVGFGVADITGAFIAGLIISNMHKTKYVAKQFDIVSYLFLSPVFFASIGLKVSLPSMSANVIWFSVVLAAVAVLTKVVGCGLGAKLCAYSNEQSLRIGVGMISRGEVALIIAGKGAQMGLLGTNFMGPVIVVVVFTTIVTPILLKAVYKRSEHIPDPEQANIAESLGELPKYK